MPDKRSHRGAHPEDGELFAPKAWPPLREAAADLSWLLSRGYADVSALKLVGDRFQLTARQRTAVARSTCSDAALDRRSRHRAELHELAGRPLLVDGYNLLTTIEAALAGGVILSARDGCYRDMASMHGTYRKVAETLPAVQLTGEFIAALGTSGCTWYLDRPVSNSGRLKAILFEAASAAGWNWQVELVPDPDVLLVAAKDLVATADSAILDRCQRWVNLASAIIKSRVPGANVVDLAGTRDP